MTKKNSIVTATTIFCIIMMGGVLLLKLEKQEQGDNSLIKESLVGNIHQQAFNYREKILQKALPSKVTQTKSYKNFMNSRMTTDQFINASRVGEVKEFVEVTFKALNSCYKEGCGQLPDEDDGFYDPALTVAQQSLRRLLEITAKYPKELDLKKWLTRTDLTDLLNVENEGVRKLALKNLMIIEGNKKGFEEILNKTRDLNEEAVATAIKGLVEHVNEGNKQEFVDTLSLIIKEKDSGTILEMLRQLDGFSVSEDQISQISEGLCRFKDKNNQNKNAIDYYIKTMASKSGIRLRQGQTCL